MGAPLFPDTITREHALTVCAWRPSDPDAFRDVASANVRHLDAFPWPSESLEHRVEQIRSKAHPQAYSLGVFDSSGDILERLKRTARAIRLR